MYRKYIYITRSNKFRTRVLATLAWHRTHIFDTQKPLFALSRLVSLPHTINNGTFRWFLTHTHTRIHAHTQRIWREKEKRMERVFKRYLPLTRFYAQFFATFSHWTRWIPGPNHSRLILLEIPTEIIIKIELKITKKNPKTNQNHDLQARERERESANIFKRADCAAERATPGGNFARKTREILRNCARRTRCSPAPSQRRGNGVTLHSPVVVSLSRNLFHQPVFALPRDIARDRDFLRFFFCVSF